MPEKATIFQGVQIGKEVTPGTAVAANKKPSSLGFVLKPEVETITSRPNGNKYPTGIVGNKKWSTFSLEQNQLTYNEFLYVLASLLSEPAPAQQGATTAYKWTFVSNTSAEDAGKTYTIEQGDATTAWRIAGARFSSMDLNFSREGITMAGGGIGKSLEKGVILTGGPTGISPIWVLPEHVTLKLADSQAGLAGATALTRGFSLNFNIGDKVELGWPLGADPYTLEGTPNVKGTLRLASDAVGLGLFDTLANAATKWCRVKATGPLIASTYYQDIQLDFPFMIESVPGFNSEGAAHVIEWGLGIVHNAAWGKAFQFDVITDLQTL